VRTPALLTPTTTEHVLLPSGRKVAMAKTTPRFPKWTGEFPWSTYGGKPILDLYGEPLYAEFVILRLLEAEGWRGVWVNHVHRGPFPTRWTPSPIRILSRATCWTFWTGYTPAAASGAFIVLESIQCH
jgi:hypothetical protein